MAVVEWLQETIVAAPGILERKNRKFPVQMLYFPTESE